METAKHNAPVTPGDEAVTIMQRPVMNPTFLDRDAHEPVSRKRRRPLWLLVRTLWRAITLFYGILTYDPIRRKRARLRVEDGTPLQRFLRGSAYRAAFVPVFLAAITCLVVYVATHPKATVAAQTPNTFDVYYEPVTFLSSDGVSLEALLYPALEAKHVVADKENALRKRYPAVVLVHDFAATRTQMLPLVRPLHDAGFVVLAVNTRGNGASGAVGQTYGLREALDVKAAVEMLRRRSFVDAGKIAVVGYGTGATAALLNAKQDPAVPAIVLADPILRGVDGVLDGRLGPPQEYLSWMRPLCKWTFEIAYRVDFDDLEWSEFKDVLEKRKVLIIGDDGRQTDLNDAKHVENIRRFLAQHVGQTDTPVADVK